MALRSLEGIREKLMRAQTGFFRAADAIAPEEWVRQPRQDSWSAGEIVAHLVVVERSILGKADQITQKAPLPIPIPFSKRMHLPMWLVEARLIRRKTPIPQDPRMLREKEVMLAELRGARERTLAFLSETKKRDLTAYCWKHPFLGMLNIYEWMEMIAAHQIRHTKQMKEVEAKLSRKL